MAQNPNALNRKKIINRNLKENKTKQYPLLNLYILITAVIEVIGQATNIFILRMIKPIPMILMIIYISGKNSQRDHLVPTLIRAGLILSLIGDLFLMVDQLSAFMCGTVFFLIAHILYCVAFGIGEKVRPPSRMNKMIRFIGCILLFALCISNIVTLWNVMPNKFLYTTYSLVLCLMALLSVKRYEITTPYSFGFTLIGGLLFGISDNLLGLLKFNHIQSHIGRGFIMLFYYGGQYLIMHGAMHHSNLQHQLNKFLKTAGTNTPMPILSIGKNNSKTNSRQWDHGDGAQSQIPINIGNKYRDE